MSDPHVGSEPFRSPDNIESMIRAAGDYVRPSEDLRPRTLEAAREHCDDRRAEQKLGGFAIAVLLLVTFSSPAIQYADVLRTSSTAPSATEMQSRAQAYEAQSHVGQHWGLTEAFTRLRRVQATRLGQPNRLIK
jgi:hypothetical protein